MGVGQIIEVPGTHLPPMFGSSYEIWGNITTFLLDSGGEMAIISIR